MVVCDVCGKQVLPGDNCSECGTAAPHTDAPLAVDPDAEARARSARQALRPLLDASLHTDRNEVATDGALPALPGVESGPLPLPPPPLVSRKPGRPKLEVVHTPLPRPIAPRQPVAAEAEERTEETPLPPSHVVAERVAAGEIVTGQHVEPVEMATMPPPGPPRLFVVPQPELTPLPPASPFSTPRPAGPQPLFVVPPTPSHPTVKLTQTPRLVWYTSAAAAIGLVALGIALVVSHPAPREPLPVAAPPAATVQAPIATPLTTAKPTPAPEPIAVKSPAIAARPTSSPVVHAPPPRRHSRPHAAPSMASSSSSVVIVIAVVVVGAVVVGARAHGQGRAHRRSICGAQMIARLVLSAALVAAVAAPAHARDKRAAAAHFQKGRALFEAASYSAALEEFNAGYEAFPLAGFLVNIGQCQRKLDRIDDAAASFQKYPRLRQHRSEGASRSAGRARRDRLRARSPRHRRGRSAPPA